MRETLFSLAPTRTFALELPQITYHIKSNMLEIIVVQGFCLFKIKITPFPKLVTGNDLRRVLHVSSSDYLRFPINTVFCAFYWKLVTLLFTFYWKLLSQTLGFLHEYPAPTVGDLQLFQNKMTNAGWAHIELAEP